MTDIKSHDRPAERHAGMIRSWHLAILRFAVTLDHADRLGVFAMAAEVDRLGASCDDRHRFGFFRRTSADLCAALPRRDAAADAILRQYLARIDDTRLKQAFAAISGITPRDTVTARQAPRAENSLWRGLASRGNAHP